MLFSSVTFLYFFLPVVLILYFISKNRVWRNAVLLTASLVFYSWGEPAYLLLLLLSAMAAFLCGLGIAHYGEKNINAKKFFLILALVILLGCLVVFKYLNFICGNIQLLTGIEIPLPEIRLPIGISFYTFQIISYIVDLFRGKVRVQKSFFRFLLYVSFFPQLIAGPIVRYETVENEISDRQESWDDIICGMRRFICGLAKKVLLANNAALVADTIFGAGTAAGTAGIWFAAICYLLQIYFDFSGYSDMAIGLGRIFGFHFLENFNYPYAAVSVTDYWRRWHISMASWFRDYVYIPLGGNRRGRLRNIANVLIVWALTGMWHGAAWNYLLWGILNALLLLFEKYAAKDLLERVPRPLRHTGTLLMIALVMTVFRNEDTGTMLYCLKTMFSAAPTDWQALMLVDSSASLSLLFIIPAAVFSFPLPKRFKKERESAADALLINSACLALFALSVIFIISSAYNPFIYFRF